MWDVGKGKCARTGAHVEFRSRRSPVAGRPSVVPRAVWCCGLWCPACRVSMLCYKNDHSKKRYGEERMVSRGFGDRHKDWLTVNGAGDGEPADRPTDRPTCPVPSRSVPSRPVPSRPVPVAPATLAGSVRAMTAFNVPSCTYVKRIEVMHDALR